MQLPQIGETWTGLYNNRNLTFKILDIVPIRDFMEREAVGLEKRHTTGEGVKYAPMLRAKIAAGNYDRFGNVYIIHYSDLEYVDGRYSILMENGLRSEWENLHPVT